MKKLNFLLDRAPQKSSAANRGAVRLRLTEKPLASAGSTSLGLKPQFEGNLELLCFYDAVQKGMHVYTSIKERAASTLLLSLMVHARQHPACAHGDSLLGLCSWLSTRQTRRYEDRNDLLGSGGTSRCHTFESHHVRIKTKRDSSRWEDYREKAHGLPSESAPSQ